MPYFFLYNTSPVGEIFGFGDSYDSPVAGRATGLRSLMQFYAQRFDDQVLRWWVDLLETADGDRPGLSALPGIILPQTVVSRRGSASMTVRLAMLHAPDTRYLLRSRPSSR